LFSSSVFSQETEVKKEYWENGKLKSEIHCGNYLIEVKEDLSDKKSKRLYLVFTDDKDNLFNSVSGYEIDRVECVDLTGDGKPELFLQLWHRGSRASSYETFVYLLENPIKLVFRNRYLTKKFTDLNQDGIQEITTWYPFRYFGGLCGACSPTIKRIFCYHEEKFKDCSALFPDHIESNLEKSKKKLISEGIKTANNLGDEKHVFLRSFAVEVLAYSMLMNKEVEGMTYLGKILPKIAHEWIEYKKFDIQKILNSKSPEGAIQETNRFVDLVKEGMNAYKKNEVH
jgi:hypothetical protein